MKESRLMPPKAPDESNRLIHDYLRAQEKDGCFPYHKGSDLAVEPTVWCAIALSEDGALRTRALKAIKNWQNADGGWSTSYGAGGSDWTSALALLACEQFAPSPAADKNYRRGVDYLLDKRAQVYTPAGRVIKFLLEGSTYASGWAWTPGCYSWVEPTSYAILALRSASEAGLTGVDDAIASARKLIGQRQCPNGGWNYGNTFVLGNLVPPFPVTSAQALIALQNNQNSTTVKKGINYLLEAAAKQDSVMTLSWMIMALDAFNLPVTKLLERLCVHQRQDGSFGHNLLSCGLASCALATAAGKNPLKGKVRQAQGNLS